jgi:hypothetical protein
MFLENNSGFPFSPLSVALIIVWNTPATGYESSIYHSTPMILWVSIVASVIVGASLVVFSITKNELKERHLWKIGLLLIVLSYIICLSLFIIRGYFMWCMSGDPADHIGWIKETLNAGQVPTSLIYPITHIFVSEIVLFTGLDLIFLHKIVPLVFGILFILFMYVFARVVFTKPSVSVLVTVISCCLVYSWYLRLTPNILANFLLPLILFLSYKYLQQKSWVWTIPLIIVLVLMPVFHAVPTIILVVVFISILILAILSNINYYTNKRIKKRLGLTNTDHMIITPFSIMLIWWIFWIMLFSAFNYQIISLYESISLEKDDMWLKDLMNVASTADAYGYSVIEQIVRNLWGQIILLIFSALSLPLIYKESLKRKKSHVISLLLAFAAVVILAIIFYLLYLGFTPQRLLFAISLFGTIFTAFFLTYVLTINGKKQNHSLRLYSRSAFTIIIVICLFIGGLLSLYPSPYILSTNWQNTRSEAAGLIHVYDHRDVNIPLTGISIAVGRLSYAILTPEERTIQKLPYDLKENDRVPWRFGYIDHYSISDNYDAETDVIITKKDKKTYIDTYPEIAEIRYTIQDFKRLKIDSGLHFLYSNGEFEYYKIKKN